MTFRSEFFLAFAFLDARSLAAAMFASKEWMSQGKENHLWEALARRRWNSKTNVGVDYALMEQNVGLLDGALAERPPALWYRAFLFAEQDSQRDRISRGQLCSIHWAFSDGLQHARFNADGTLHMELYPPLRWRFDANHSIQIENFPLHTVARRRDWGWVISNPLICFNSEGRRAADELGPMPLPPDATYADVVRRLEEIRASKERDATQRQDRELHATTALTPHLRLRSLATARDGATAASDTQRPPPPPPSQTGAAELEQQQHEYPAVYSTKPRLPERTLGDTANP